MERYTETQQRILDVGKQEFLEKGFREASLRGIVKKAGFTQGAFYGYYPDKAALFDALVSEAADGLIFQFKEAQIAHFDLIPQGHQADSSQLSTEYLRHFIDYIYDHFDAFKLILCCSAGTRYENYIHELVELEVSQTERFYAQLRQQDMADGSVSRELHHLITSAYFTAVFETVVHDMTRERAMLYIEELATFFNGGWEALLRLK